MVLHRTVRSLIRVSLQIIMFALVTAFLMSMLFPGHRVNHRVREINCANQLRQIGTALALYASDNNGYFPNKELFQLCEGGYLAPGKVFVCPNSDTIPTSQPAEFKAGDHSDYRYCGHHFNASHSGQRSIPIAYELQGFHTNRVHVLFSDGEVKFVSGQKAEELIGHAISTGQAKRLIKQVRHGYIVNLGIPLVVLCIVIYQFLKWTSP